MKFRADEITGLHTYPSAAGQEEWTVRRSLARRILWLSAMLAAIAMGVVVLAGVAVYFLGVSGINIDGVRDEAEAALASALGVDVDAELGPARVSFDGAQLVGIEVNDVRFTQRGGTTNLVSAGSVRFGLRILPLLGGKVRLGSATIADARLVTSALPAGEGRWIANLSNADGLIDPDRVVRAVFTAVHRALGAFAAGSTERIELDNVEVVLPRDGEGGGSVVIGHASLARPGAGKMTFSATVDVRGRQISLKGAARRDRTTGRIEDLRMSLAAPAAIIGGVAGKGIAGRSIGAIDVKVAGSEGIDGEASRLRVTADLGDSTFDIGSNDTLSGSMTLAASLVTGTGKVEIERGRILVDRSRVEFHGAVGPKPRSDDDKGAPVYRYELVSDGSVIAPADSPEPALDILARLAGTFDAKTAHLRVDDIGVRTMGGELLGTAAFDFDAGKAPGIVLALSIPRMPASHLKQLWPWLAAGGARRWALNNLFGGMVTDSWLRYRVPVGRLGNGVPLTRDEVSGHFRVTGSRFDVTGRIPPMRDAVGTIDFHGNDVDIALESGTVFLPSGREVAASDGTLTIRGANQPRVVGDLDMGVSGDADAVTELASYEPINAMHYLGMTADEFSGKVSGKVQAQVPLHGIAEGERLPWHVALDFTDLAISRAFDGQLATEATGSIDVDPTRAVIKAKARLNGAPAEIDMVEPIGGSTVERHRDIAVILDDDAREKLAPGLSTMLDGPVKVRFETAGTDGKRRIEADLTDARLDVPWAGWSKGPGIAAKTSFQLSTSDDTTRLSDFSLSGKSFKVAGDVVLSGGSLSSATFDTVQLNRGDDVRVAIKRSGRRYTVDVKGASLDARALIKLYMSDAEGVASKTDAKSVSVDAQVGALGGFGGERLSDVTFSYAGDGSRVDSLKVDAASTRGGRVTFRGGTENGQRTMRMQSNDAGAIVRFLDIYEHMEGGVIDLSLAGGVDSPMRGKVDATDFWVVNEPRLASIVSTTPSGDRRSLNQAIRKDIDTSRVKFERGYATIVKAPGRLDLDDGILRGPLIGLAFGGTLYDKAGNMSMAGTFMPAYGLNRIFGEIPLVGMILGNGSDRGLIGVTFRLSGNANKPSLQVNPLSAIAPGIFRSIFEFRK